MRGDLLGIVYGNNSDGIDVGRSAVAIVKASAALSKLFPTVTTQQTP